MATSEPAKMAAEPMLCCSSYAGCVEKEKMVLVLRRFFWGGKEQLQLYTFLSHASDLSYNILLYRTQFRTRSYYAASAFLRL